MNAFIKMNLLKHYFNKYLREVLSKSSRDIALEKQIVEDKQIYTVEHGLQYFSEKKKKIDPRKLSSRRILRWLQQQQVSAMQVFSPSNISK